jgi:hypothetical protein
VDRSAAHSEAFVLADLAVGDYVSVRGVEFPAKSGEVRASVIERRDATEETELQGFVQSFVSVTGSLDKVLRPGNVQILGVTIVTGENSDCSDAGCLNFYFDYVGEGAFVYARGARAGDRTIDATWLTGGDSSSTGP